MGRTSKNIKLRIPEKTRKIKGFRTGSYRVATTISSQSRYDHFDTSPNLSQHQHLKKRRENQWREHRNIKLKIPVNTHKIRGFQMGIFIRQSQSQMQFTVNPVIMFLIAPSIFLLPASLLYR